MQDDHTLPDKVAVKRSAYAFGTARPNLEQAVAHGFRVGHPKIGTKLRDLFNHAAESRINARRPTLDV